MNLVTALVVAVCFHLLTDDHTGAVALDYLTETICGQPVSHRPRARTDRSAVSAQLRLVIQVHGYGRLPGVAKII